jgi:methylase of polypeptide subunit release factors
VDERVLIPRNDTEVLVKVALEKLLSEIDMKNMWYFDV